MPKLKLSLREPSKEQQEEAKSRAKQAETKKKQATETLEEAWGRIFSLKNSEADKNRLTEVYHAMKDGAIGRELESQGKRFSKAEALRLHRQLMEQQKDRKLKELVEGTPDSYILVDTVKKLSEMRQYFLKVGEGNELIAIDCETFGEDGGALDPWKGNMAGFSVSTRERNFYVPLNHTEKTEFSDKFAMSQLKDILENTPSVMHNAPFDCKWFYVKYGINLIDNLHADTRIMAMALDENRDHRLKNLLTDWLGIKSDNFDQLFADKISKFNEIPLDVALPYAAGDTEKTLKLYDWMMKHLNSGKLTDIKRLIFEVEMPVCRQFIKSDIRGIRFDTNEARKLDDKFAEEEAQLKEAIDKHFGEEINLNSPAQLKKKLFEELKLTDIAKGSTGVKVLKKIKNEHPVIPLILEYRGVGKLRQAFTQKLPNNVRDGKIHPWHNSFGAATGRFTCSNPNTQQIPAKRPEVRRLFTSTSADRILVSIDYSQIELRVLAHMAKDQALIKAFHEGRDIHSTTAAMISGGKYDYEDIEADKDSEGHECQKLRKQAKVVNFGIVYGMSAKGLSDTLEITKVEAQKIIDNYFKGYAGIERYMNDQKKIARKQGFITDIFGRKRRLHDEYSSKDRFLHFRADRQAGNYPIQASAGSILKKAIVDLQEVLPELDSYILLQVHDELVFDCPRNIPLEEINRIRETMENAVKLAVPVRCDVEISPNKWMENISLGEWFNDNNS